MAGRPITNVPRQFDDAKLASMVEPLTIRVERRKGTSRTPIPLPAPEDGRPAGTDWTKDQVRQLEAWLVTEWAGGGYYEITVTDSSVPTPITMKWEPYFNPQDYPEKTPPTLADARAANPTPIPTQASPTPPIQMVRPMNPVFPGGLPPGLPNAPAAAAPQPMQFGAGYSSPYGYQPYGSGYYAAMAAQAQQQQQQQTYRPDDQVQKLQRELQEERERSMKAQHERDLREARAAADEQVKALQTQIAELRNLVATQTTASAKNPELEALREAQRAAEAKYERERAEREAEKRDQQLRDMMRQQQEQMQRQFEAMQAQTQTMLAALTKGNDAPNALVMALQETSRQQLQAMKDISQAQAQQFDRVQQMVLRPQDIMALTKESSSSIDSITERISRQAERAFEMQTRVMEQALQMQPQGSGAAEIVREGVDVVKTAVERYTGFAQVKAQVEADKQVQVARANAEAVAHAAMAQTAQAQGRVYAPPPRVEAQLPSGGGLNGVSGMNGIKPIGGPLAGPKRLGKTDAEWFSVLLSEVGQLREGVKVYIESLHMQPVRIDPKTGKPEGIDAEAAAGGIIQASQMISANNIPIPAMAELLNEKRYADFMDVLLPDAPQPYRDDVAALLIKQAMSVTGKPVVDVSLRQPEPANDEAEDDGDDDVDDDAEPVIEAKPVKPVKAAKHARA